VKENESRERAEYIFNWITPGKKGTIVSARPIVVVPLMKNSIKIENEAKPRPGSIDIVTAGSRLNKRPIAAEPSRPCKQKFRNPWEKSLANRRKQRPGLLGRDEAQAWTEYRGVCGPSGQGILRWTTKYLLVHIRQKKFLPMAGEIKASNGTAAPFK
jgi:hypothetical protein